MKRWEQFLESNFYKVWRKLIHRRVAAAGLIVCAVILILVVFGDLISPYDPQQINTIEALQPPSAAHWFGTDEMGRDLFSRVIYGARLTMAVSVVAVAISLAAGTALGLISGYAGGAVDLVISKFIEALSAFPMIMFALTITAILGPGLRNVMIAIGVAYVPAFARIVRGMTLTVREREYIESAVSIGLNRVEILLRYVLPNVSSVIIVQASLAAASAILSEASMSFLGVGVQAPQASWGAMLKAGYNYLSMAPWMSVFPGVAIVLAVLALNFVGDGLRDALDVRLKMD